MFATGGSLNCKKNLLKKLYIIYVSRIYSPGTHPVLQSPSSSSASVLVVTTVSVLAVVVDLSSKVLSVVVNVDKVLISPQIAYKPSNWGLFSFVVNI